MIARAMLDSSSLAIALWNLEEARLAGTPYCDPRVIDALEWVAGRSAKPGAYRESLFAPTDADVDNRLATPTGEDSGTGRAGVRHILGEEAVHTLLGWQYTSGWASDRALAEISDHFGARGYRPGRFCCSRCSVARWRALAVGRPAGWEDILSDGLAMLREFAAGGRWRRFPFCYTLLALGEIPLAEVERERRRVQPAAERTLARLKGDDQPSRFRRRALEWALD